MTISDESSITAGRFAHWWSGWRIAIRIARRDARRYKWRSALIVAMVGLPVLLLTGGITLMATNDISLAESVPSVMGSAQARIHGGSAVRQIQSPDGLIAGGGAYGGADGSAPLDPALAVPGFTLDSAWTTSKVQKLTGGRVIQMSNAMVRVTVGDRRPTMWVLGIDARDPLARGMTELVTGRWASTTSEIVVTKAGIAAGLPDQGSLMTTNSHGDPLKLTVVGVATAQTEQNESYNLPFLVALPDLVMDVAPQVGWNSAYLVERADPVTWSDVRTMNDHGALVQSRQVFLHPPSDAELDPRAARTIVPNQRQNDLVLLMAAVGLFIEATLLAGPAFAVSAARQRRSLALAASNGAEARQLRRYVLGQALVLGVLSATIALVAGVLLTLAGLTWWRSGHADFVSGPFDVSWPRVLGVFACAVLACVVAALLPAKGIARLDIVSVLAGRSGNRKVRRGLPVAGVAVMVLSGIATLWSVRSSGADGMGLNDYLVVVAGAVGLVLGALLVIPALLALVGRLSTHLALPLRLAARDTARQRGRSTPAVAAIMAAVGALTALSIGAGSTIQQREDQYTPRWQMSLGSGVIDLNAEDTDRRTVLAVLDRLAPQLVVDPTANFGWAEATPTVTERRKASWVSALPPGCSDAEMMARFAPDRPNPALDSCEYRSNESVGYVGNLSSLSKAFPLSTSQRAVLEDGGMLITDPDLIQDGRVSYVGGTATLDGSGTATGYAITAHTRVRAVVVDPRVWAEVTRGSTSGAWILPSTAKKLGWPVSAGSVMLTSPTGMISAEEEAAVADRLGDGYDMYVERGYENQSWLILLIAFSVAGLLVLIASLISTALSLAEGQNDMATLAAVGATRHTRRGIAACQALVVAACGCLLGVAVGLIPGIASTWPLTVHQTSLDRPWLRSAPVIEIPWLPLVGLVMVVPLLAAGLAWFAVRRHPQVTRRLV